MLRAGCWIFALTDLTGGNHEAALVWAVLALSATLGSIRQAYQERHGLQTELDINRGGLI